MTERTKDGIELGGIKRASFDRQISMAVGSHRTPVRCCYGKWTDGSASSMR